MKNNDSLAKFLAENIEKENIISKIFMLFDVDSIQKCQLNPSELDNLIKKFNENDECDLSILAEIITFLKGEQKDIENKENELIQKIKSHIDVVMLHIQLNLSDLQ
jgi:predicted glycosyltransferase